MSKNIKKKPNTSESETTLVPVLVKREEFDNGYKLTFRYEVMPSQETTATTQEITFVETPRRRSTETRTILGSELLKEAELQRAERDFSLFRAKYGNLKELAPIIGMIDEFLSTRKTPKT